MPSNRVSNAVDDTSAAILNIKGLQYSPVDIKSLGALEYTVVGLSVDESGSVSGWVPELRKTVKEIVKACNRSPRAENLLLRVTSFDSQLTEVHGFKELRNVNPSDYDAAFARGGSTALSDAAVNIIGSVGSQGEDLVKEDYTCNGIVFVMTDGWDNASSNTVADVKKALAKIQKDEKSESLISILVGVGSPTDPDTSTKDTLEKFAKDGGFTQFVWLADASEKSLAKLAQFISKSVSSQSSALGSGCGSVPLTI